MERLQISKNNRRFVTADGKPFIWLADTAWTLPQRVKWDDVDYYMEKRKEQGFTVLQMVALDPEQDVKMRNPAGIPALHNQDLNQPCEAYFQYLDYILDRAEYYGFYVFLLPVWGQLVTGDNWSGEVFQKTVTAENAYEFGEWIGSRYKNRTNLVWCLGGDRHPIHQGNDYRPVWRKLAEGLGKGLTGRGLSWNADRDEWQKLLITYHTCYEAETGRCSTRDDWTAEDAWISFVMLQSGHSEKSRNYVEITKEYLKTPVLPVFDGEPAYEKMAKCWPPVSGMFFDEEIVRKRAYWALFSGTFGHTYGHASVWCMISEKERDDFRPYSWYEALDHAGAWQIKYLRDLLESRSLDTTIPCQELIRHQCTSDCRQDHRQACITEDNQQAFVYLSAGGSETLRMEFLASRKLQCWWWNPRDGKCYDNQNQVSEKPFLVSENTGADTELCASETGINKDWILIVETFDDNKAVPGLARVYTTADSAKEKEAKKVFDWQ